MTVLAAAALPPVKPHPVSDFFYRRRALLVLLLLTPPLLWVGVVYVGSLLALLVNSFFGLDHYSG